MRVVFIGYDRPSYSSGPIVNIKRLLPELKRRGHDPTALIMYHGRAGANTDYLVAQGVECRTLPYSPGFTERHIYWILRQLRDIEPDVFVPNISVPGYFAARWVRAAGIPTIATHRCDDPFHWDMVHEFVLGEKKWAVSGLVCVSENLRQRVERLGPKYTRLCTIPSGVPIPRSVASPDESLRLVYVGRMCQQQKRILDVAKALCCVVQRVPGAEVTLFGDGPDRERAQKIVENEGVDSKIHFAGVVPSEKIHECLKGYHILVLLSDCEGTPGAVMDAMACGLVPVCLDIPGGVRELVVHGRTGLLVSDRGEAFVFAIRRLAEDIALRRRLSSNARKCIMEGYSLEQVVDRWERFFKELLTECKPRCKIRLPWLLCLPPVRTGLEREDRRRFRVWSCYLELARQRRWGWLESCILKSSQQERSMFSRAFFLFAAHILAPRRHIVRKQTK